MNPLYKKLTCFKFISKEIQVFVKFKNNLQCGFLIGICFKDILNIRDLKIKCSTNNIITLFTTQTKQKSKLIKLLGQCYQSNGHVKSSVLLNQETQSFNVLHSSFMCVIFQRRLFLTWQESLVVLLTKVLITLPLDTSKMVKSFWIVDHFFSISCVHVSCQCSLMFLLLSLSSPPLNLFHHTTKTNKL